MTSIVATRNHKRKYSEKGWVKLFRISRKSKIWQCQSLLGEKEMKSMIASYDFLVFIAFFSLSHCRVFVKNL